MYQKNKFLSPDHRVNLIQDRSGLAPPNIVNRHASVKYLDRNGKNLAEDQPEIPLRKRIQNYVYSSADLIGEGFTSKVYKARRDGSDQTFAVKVVDLKKYSSSNREMLESEINILKSLNHPHVIRCYDVFMTLNNCYIITEYCQGGDLLSHLRKNRRPDRASLTRLMRQVLQGYQYLSGQGIVHRDIKPANILFNQGKCKIADFGFAKKADALRFKQNYNVGTPLYMPPEALLRNKYSYESDIFSLGVLFYEMTVGCAPWESRSQKELIAKMTKQPLKFPAHIVIDKDLKDLISGCLAIDVKDRFTPEKLFSCEFATLLLGNPEEMSSCSEEDTAPKRKLSKMLNMNTTPSLSTVASLGNITPIVSANPSPNSTYTNTNTNVTSPTSAQTFHNRYLTLTDPSARKITKPKSTSTAETSSEADEAQRKRTFERNSTQLLSQVNFCRFMYYLAKNKIPLMRMKNQKEKMNIILFKHILKIMAKLVDNTANHFQLKEWERYSKSPQYHSVLKTIKDYHSRYVFEFGVYKSKLQIIQQVEDAVPFLSLYQLRDLDREFYRMVSSYIKLHVKQININLTMESKKNQGFTSDMATSVEGLRVLLKYYHLLDMLTNNFEDYEYFMQHSAISVVTDFSKNTSSPEKYEELKARINLLGI